MPPDREQNSAATITGRQKACTRCVKSKRRCDLQQPSCLRCTRQHFICSYPSRARVHDSPSAEPNSPMPDSGIDTTFSFDMPMISCQNTALLDFDLNAGIESIDFLHDLIKISSPMSVAHESDLSLVQPVPILKNKKCVSKLTHDVYPRIKYPLAQLKRAPATMVLENQTPWSHPLLYEEHMPRAIQDARATCALYMARNKTNSTFFAHHIIDRVQELIRSPPPSTPLETLARAHALLLYQIMHAFSGDVRLTANLETTLPHAEKSISDLYTFMQQDCHPLASALPVYPATSARQAWNAFILRQSRQRTMLSMSQFMILWQLLQGREYCADRTMMMSRVVCSAHLWNASSTLEFARAWNEKRHFLVEDLDFTEIMKDGQPDDVDVFGRMLLVSLMGEDDMKGWFYARGGAF